MSKVRVRSQVAGLTVMPKGKPTPTPTPPPPLTLSAISPANVFARTGDFTLQVSGDKFTPQARIHIDGQPLETQFAGPQRLAASVPAGMIANPGARQVMVRTPDGQLYSNAATLNIMQPPAPTYTYIGLLASRTRNRAILKDQKNELLTVELNDLVGGRFRVTGITGRAVELTDQQLKIKHTLPFTEANRTAAPADPRARTVTRPQPQPQPQPQPIEPPAEPVEVPEEEEPTEP